MTWLLRHRLSQYFRESLWILPALGLFLGLVAFWPLHAIEEMMGWKLKFDPSTAQTLLDSRVPKGANVILVATSSGLAPFVSMLSTYLRFPPERRVALIHGVRYSWDLGYRSILMALERLRTNFTYIPVVSRPKEEPVPWKGATGHVQDVWKSGPIEKAWGIRPGPENTHVFMCGSPRMSESMNAMLLQEGFKEDTKNEPGQIQVEKYWQ